MKTTFTNLIQIEVEFSTFLLSFNCKKIAEWDTERAHTILHEEQASWEFEFFISFSYSTVKTPVT